MGGGVLVTQMSSPDTIILVRRERTGDGEPEFKPWGSFAENDLTPEGGWWLCDGLVALDVIGLQILVLRVMPQRPNPEAFRQIPGWRSLLTRGWQVVPK